MARRSGSRMRWCATTVAGRPARFGVGGSGPPLVFLHGWAWRTGLTRGRSSVSRPGMHATRVLPVIVRDLVPSLVRNSAGSPGLLDVRR